MLPACLQGSSQTQSLPTINEIVLEATAGLELTTPGRFYGSAFKVTFQRDGLAFYAGSREVKLIGSYQGTMSADEFEKLAKFVNAKDYAAIRTNEAAEGDVLKPKTTITITYEGGRRKTIWRLTELSPAEREQLPKALFEIEQAILDASARIKWREVE